MDPEVDSDSVRVEGYGLATITDIQTDLVPRKIQFEDQYPDLQNDDDLDFESDSQLSEDEFGVDRSAVDAAKSDLRSAEASLAEFQNSRDTSVKVLGFLDHYGQTLKPEETDVAKMTGFLDVYRETRKSESKTYNSASADITLWTQKVADAREKLDRAEKAFRRAKDLASREIRRQREKQKREREQKLLQKRRAVQQRRRFWTSNVGQILVSLDRASEFTPSSSRRQSMISVTDSGADYKPSKPLAENTINLRLTYVVPNASWMPRYELKLSTPKSSAQLVYRAEFENNTSETWRNAKITFSTSQTFFSGLDEKIPTLEAWHVKLGTGFGVKGIPTSSIQSRSELMANNIGMRGTDKVASTDMKLSRKKMIAGPNAPLASAANRQNQMAPAALFGGTAQTRSAFGHASAPPPPPPPPPMGAVFRRYVSSDDDESDVETLHRDMSISHQDSTRQDYGLTTTYDVPGQRTLEPSAVRRRHVIAELPLASISLSHILIPKLRRAAFFKARITNTSSISLLPGKAGMTVDGTFLGSTTLSSCEPGHFIDLSLGVDPSVLVSYAQPTAHRSTTGFFSKEDSAVFTRSCWIKNTKKSDVSIIVLDQIPVSEDENLRIRIIEPKGLEKENDTANLQAILKKGENGKGNVTLEKNGQIKWNITLRPGKDVKLVLEYESRIPSGQQIVGLD